MIDFTVAICTYNGANRLPQVLERLRSQTGINAFTWEVLVADNNSTDDTAAIVHHYATNYSLRYCFEPRQGIAFARRRAINAARGELVGFLDDDNLPSNTWVAAAYKFGQLHPRAGAYGSQIHGRYEIEPPEHFERICCFLPVTERGPEPLLYDAKKGLLPPGAGIVIRKQAWQESVPAKTILRGVSATSLASKGEDIETLTYIRKAGWEIWYNPEMEIDHAISRSRFERTYLLRFFRGVGFSRYPTRMARFDPWQRPLLLPVYMVNDLRKFIVYWCRSRQRDTTDLVTICELQLLWCSFISPFYYWQKSLHSCFGRKVKPVRTLSSRLMKPALPD